jgi:histidine decarboxylase
MFTTTTLNLHVPASTSTLHLNNSNSVRFKSTAVQENEPASTAELAQLAKEFDAQHAKESPAASTTEDATEEKVRDYTSDKSKSGTPSPWAVFDAWGAGGDDISPALTPEQEDKLSPASVRIPTSETDDVTKVSETEILQAYDDLLKQRSSVHFGYPYNLMYNHEELYQFMKYSINNLGDPFVTSNYGVHSRQFECSVIDFFARLWSIPEDEYWGYVTTCGTEGNLHGILLARECHPDGILYSSKETHYSIFKAARYYRMDAKAIPTLPMGEIDYDILASEIAKNLDRPVIINVNIGTTVKGAVDNLDRILRILNNLNIPRERFHIHCDGALFAMMMPFVDFAPEITFKKPIDSIAVSGHKMLGCPMPCGVTIARKEHVKKVEQRIDYLNSVDTTIMGSRNGQAALYLWYSLRKKGLSGIKRDVV